VGLVTVSERRSIGPCGFARLVLSTFAAGRRVRVVVRIESRLCQVAAGV